MKTSQMKYFIVTAECLSFTQAAERLYMTQPALSRHISTIESELGCKLFYRTKNRVWLTDAGKCLYKGLIPVLESYTRLIKEVSEINAGAVSTISIGILANINLPEFFRALLEDIRVNFPDITLDLPVCNFQELVDGLISSQYDAILTTIQDFPNVDDLDFLLQDSSPFGLLISKTYSVSNRNSISASELKDALKNIPYIEIGDTRLASPSKYDLFNQVDYHPAIRSVKDPAQQAMEISSGLGVAVVGSAHSLINDPNVKFIPITDFPACELALIWKRGQETKEVRLLVHRAKQILPRFMG